MAAAQEELRTAGDGDGNIRG
ncbi:uncharacterized protein G2W53_011439 [Senna tora]|uniref:Uncharacterized protein n=1 Tax=Senna tora TaxID=362788 RepID=A0A835CD82_9FABA|nr:uncharacterized protein G2W53_011439 [Senna tora]